MIAKLVSDHTSIADPETIDEPRQPVKSQRVQHKELRLKAALKANMAKRKAQVRARSDTVMDDHVTDVGLTAEDTNTIT